MFCSTEKVSVTFYTGMEYQPSAVQNTRTIYCLWALGGKLDVKGGLYIDRYPAEQVEECEIRDGYVPVGAIKYPLLEFMYNNFITLSVYMY